MHPDQALCRGGHPRCESCPQHVQNIIGQLDHMIAAVRADGTFAGSPVEAVTALISQLECRLDPDTFFDEPRDGAGREPACISRDFGPDVLRALQPLYAPRASFTAESWLSVLEASRGSLAAMLAALDAEAPAPGGDVPRSDCAES